MSETDEPMRIRDRDLRKALHRHGARPGTKLWRLLRELQERRDADSGESEPGRQRGAGRGRLSAPI